MVNDLYEWKSRCPFLFLEAHVWDTVGHKVRVLKNTKIPTWLAPELLKYMRIIKTFNHEVQISDL